jgi:hypothetical protein
MLLVDLDACLVIFIEKKFQNFNYHRFVKNYIQFSSMAGGT